jgi:hypothetical protein
VECQGGKGTTRELQGQSENQMRREEGRVKKKKRKKRRRKEERSK